MTIKPEVQMIKTVLLGVFFLFGSLFPPLNCSNQHVNSFVHKTQAASEKVSDLWCYRCDSMVDGERCLDLQDNSSFLHTKCNHDHRICRVKRISMSTSTEDTTGKPKLWLLQRNCSKVCEAGCIVIGERTKLHSCTTCCENSFCNAGSNARNYKPNIFIIFATLISTVISKYITSNHNINQTYRTAIPLTF